MEGWVLSFLIYGSEAKESACNAGKAGDVDLIAGWQDPLELWAPCDLAGKESTCNAGYLDLISGLGRFPWRRERLPTPVFWPGEFHGLYSPWGHKESDMTEQLSLSLSK